MQVLRSRLQLLKQNLKCGSVVTNPQTVLVHTQVCAQALRVLSLESLRTL